MTRLLACFILLISYLSLQAQNEIELKSDGILFPRLTTSARNLLIPSQGQCIFNIDYACIECFDFGGNWRTYDFRKINDSDANTYVTTEYSSNIDMITLGIAGTKLMDIRNNSFGKPYFDQVYDNGNMIFGGGGTGLSFNSTAFRNTSFGAVNLHALVGGDDNTAFGTQSLTLNSDGNNNTAIGSKVLEMGTSINRNTGVGVNALTNCSADDNIAIGFESLMNSTSGVRNLAFGNYSLKSMNVSSSDNIAIGYNTLNFITTSNRNLAIGNEAGAALQTTSNGNVLLGHDALKVCTQSASDNIAIGSAMTQANFDPSTFMAPLSNVAIGTSALNRTSGRYNIGIGWQSLSFHELGSGNTAIGIESLVDLVTGSRNTAVGFGAMRKILGQRNTGIGHGAGQFATGSMNVFIGNEAGSNESGDNKLHIANTSTKTLIEGDFSTDEVTINNIVNLTPRSTVPVNPSTGTIYMDDGTNTSGTPALRVYINSTIGWKNL